MTRIAGGKRVLIERKITLTNPSFATHPPPLPRHGWYLMDERERKKKRFSRSFLQLISNYVLIDDDGKKRTQLLPERPTVTGFLLRVPNYCGRFTPVHTYNIRIVAIEFNITYENQKSGACL